MNDLIAVTMCAIMELHNPGNIRLNGIEWIGMTDHQSSRSFVQFKSDEYGYRAIAKILLTYQHEHHILTVPAIISRYAPSIENPTSDYIWFVLEQSGIRLYTKVNLQDPETLFKLIKAMTQFEQGSKLVYTKAQAEKLRTGIRMALED